LISLASFPGDAECQQQQQQGFMQGWFSDTKTSPGSSFMKLAQSLLPQSNDQSSKKEGKSSDNPSEKPSEKVIVQQHSDEWFSATATHYARPGHDDLSNPNNPQNPPSCVSHGKITNSTLDPIQMKRQLLIGAPDDIHPNVWGDPYCGNDSPPQCKDQRSCGTCYEIKCVAKFWAKERDFSNMKDTSVCREGKSVAIMVVDACPSDHPINKGKEKNGELNPCKMKDYANMDLGYKAFEKIANLDVGHIHAKFRRIDCAKVNEINGRK